MELSQEELLCRKDTLKQFENYIENATITLNNFVEQIGWTLDETPTDVNALVECPINSEHRVMASKLDNHCQMCILKQNGYDSTQSLYPSYNISTSLGQTIKIDKVTQMQILKSAYEESNFTLNMFKESLVQDILQYFHNVLQNKKPHIKPDFREVSESIERYVCDFTPDERRILYDNAVKNTKLHDYDNVRNDLTGINVFNKTDEKPKTELELLQEQRDLKRRRAAYRGRRVHTDRKSYVEVLREVVEGLTNSLSQQEDKYICSAKTTNITTESVSNNRIVYKYAGNRNDGGNPYTRWLDIKEEESKLFKYYEKKNDNSYKEASTSRTYYSKDTTNYKKSRNSRSKSRGRRRSSSELKLKGFRRSRSRSKFKETEYSRSKRLRSPLHFNETKYKRPKIQLKSKETIFKKSRSRSLSIESEYKKSKRFRTRSKSKDTLFRKSRSQSLSIENKCKRSKKHRTRSKSKELSLRRKDKHSKSPINYSKLPLLNEYDTTVKYKSGDNHKKKSKHKKKRKRSKSPKKSHKSKKNNNIEACKHFDGKISKDNSVPSTNKKSR